MPINTMKGMDKIINYNDCICREFVIGWVTGSLSLHNPACVGSDSSCVGTYSGPQDLKMTDMAVLCWQNHFWQEGLIFAQLSCNADRKRAEHTHARKNKKTKNKSVKELGFYQQDGGNTLSISFSSALPTDSSCDSRPSLCGKQPGVVGGGGGN